MILQILRFLFLESHSEHRETEEQYHSADDAADLERG